MRKDSATALTPTNAKQSVPPRSAPVGSRNSTANTRARNSASEWANNRRKLEEPASFPRDDNVVPYSVRAMRVHNTGSSAAFAQVASGAASAFDRNTANTVEPE